MQASDFPAFVDAHKKMMAVYHIHQISHDELTTWFSLLSTYSLEEISKAFFLHLKDLHRGQKPPLPADIFFQLQKNTVISPSIAWSIALAAQDHWKSVAWTLGMKNAWETAEPIYAIGDHYGARKAFIDSLSLSAGMAGMDQWLLSCGNVDPKDALQDRREAIQHGLKQGYYNEEIAADLENRYCKSVEHSQDSQELPAEETSANIQRLKDIIHGAAQKMRA